MAIPIDGRTIDNILSFTLDAKLPEVTDNFFNTNALLQKLYQRGGKGGSQIRFDGGAEIRSSILYNDVQSGSYGRGFTFPTDQREFATDMQFQWKRSYAVVNVDRMDARRNMGSEVQIINYVETLTQNAFNSLMNNLGYQIFGTQANATTGVTEINGSIPATDFDGLYNGVLATGTYGGVVRGATPRTPGAAIRAQVVAAGGAALSLGLLQQAYGLATFTPAQPDLIVTTQNLWNQIWQRVQPQDRNSPGPLREVGFNTIRFNGAEVVVDSHCPPGYVYLLNTEYIQLWLMDGSDFIRRGSQYGEEGFPVPQQDAYIDQLIVYGDLIVPGPRYQAVITGITE